MRINLLKVLFGAVNDIKITVKGEDAAVSGKKDFE